MAASPQPLTGYHTNEEWDALLERARERLERVESLDDGATRTAVFELLDDLDSIHREALHRLVRLFKEGVLEQVATDPAIHTLLELYDLLPAEQHEARPVPIRFYRKNESPIGASTPLREPRSPLPHWQPVASAPIEVPVGAILLAGDDATPIALTRVQGVVFAVSSRCAQDGALIDHAQVRHYTLVCPHHQGCYYDVRTGKRLAGEGTLTPFTVRAPEGGPVAVGIGMPYQHAVPIL